MFIAWFDSLLVLVVGSVVLGLALGVDFRGAVVCRCAWCGFVCAALSFGAG